MRLVHLELPSEADEPASLDIVADFTGAEIAVLSQYRSLAQRVRDCTLLQRGMTGFQGLTFDGAGLSIRAGTCSSAELYELLHVLRPVTLQKERASFSKVLPLLANRLSDEVVHKFLQINQHTFQHGEMRLFFQVSVGDKQLFHESLLRTWLNGTQYHTDANKAADWAALEATLGEPSAKAVVMSQLRSKVVSVFNVDYIAKQVLAAPQRDA
jgi:hypothetical protein